MPIYVYRCEQCEHEYDRLEKLSDPPQDECPVCNGTGRRIITGAHGKFQLKGEKWYKNSGEY